MFRITCFANILLFKLLFIYSAITLSPYEISKGTLKFPLNKPLPFDLIKKIVEFRVKENLRKK